MKAVAVAVLVLAFGCGGGETAVPDVPDKVVATGATPEEAFKNYQRAVKAEDLDFLWSFLSDKDKRGKIGDLLAPMNGKNVPAARMAEFASGFKLTPDAVHAMGKHDFDRHFIGMVVAKGAPLIPDQKIVKVSTTGDTAILIVDVPADTRFAMIREHGQWHWDMAATSAANGK